jgi:hypothetical protein
MSFFLFYFFITFFTLAGVGLFINFCRRRLRKTSHGLTGMCHKDGGTMCCSCSQAMTRHKKKTVPSTES